MAEDTSEGKKTEDKESATEGEDKEESTDQGEPEVSGGGKKKLIIMVAALVLLLAGGGGAYFFVFAGEEVPIAEAMLPEPPVYHDLDPLTVDLKSDRCRSPYLKFQATVQLSASDLEKLEEVKLEIIDGVTTFLRSQTRQDLVGTEGAEKLRAGLIGVINRQIAPAKVFNVLFKVFILQ